MKLRNIAQAAALAASALLAAQAGAANLITNGDFEQSTSLGGNPSVGGIGQLDSIVTAPGWTNANSNNFNFIVDATADDSLSGFTGGFTSVNSQGAGTNIFVYGPGNGTNNGFTASSNGGKFLGGDGGYATGPVTQVVSGLTPGMSYELSFEWAGAQFTDQSGDYWVGWDVSFGMESFSVGGMNTGAVASHGFKGWETETHTFTASSSSQTLTFLATGPTGLPPFSLLDGVSLTPPGSPPPAVPEPESLALMLAGAAVLVAKRRRDAKRAA